MAVSKIEDVLEDIKAGKFVVIEGEKNDFFHFLLVLKLGKHYSPCNYNAR